MEKKYLYFRGRPDGMGNRLQELIQLDYFAEKHSYKIIYYWNIEQKDKGVSKILGPVDYPHRFICKNIIFKDNAEDFPKKSFEKTNLWREYVSYDRYPHNIKNIKFNFDVKFDPVPFIGIHTRSLDRIVEIMDSDSKYRGLSDLNTYQYALEKTYDYISNQNKFKYLYICGDSKSEVEKLKAKFKDQFDFINYENYQNVEDYYVDLFMLSNANKIVMASLFSSFAITAPILQNKPFITFFPNYDTEVNRFPLNYIYKGDAEIPSFSINLPVTYQPLKINELIKLGKSFGSDYLIDQDSLLNSKYLISYSSKTDSYFEEHFKLLGNSKLIILNKNQNLKSFISNLINLTKLKFNKKKYILDLLNIRKRYLFNIFNKFSFLNTILFFLPLKRKFKLFYKFLPDCFIFVEVNINNLDLLSYLVQSKKKPEGLIILFDDFENIKKYADDFVENYFQDICYVKAEIREGKINLIVSFTKKSLNEKYDNLPASFDNTNFGNISSYINFIS